MKYDVNKVNPDLAKEGIEEALRIKICNLETMMEISTDNEQVQGRLNEYFDVKKVARSFGMDTSAHDNYILDKSQELKERFGIEIK